MKPKARRREGRDNSPAPLAPASFASWLPSAIGIALFVLTLLAFSNSFQAGFTLDNRGLLRDPRLEQATAHNLGLIVRHTYWWPNGESGLYRPFTTLTYLFNFAILGNRDQPAGYHWVNFVLHAANVLLVFALFRRWAATWPLAALTAAAWAVHPLLTESVTNIVGRADLLAGMSTLGGFLMYLKGAESTGSRRLAWLAGLLATTFVGVFSKESAVCILGVIVIYELVAPVAAGDKQTSPPLSKRLPPLLTGCAATAIPIAFMLYQRSRILGASLPAEFPFTDNPIIGADIWIGRLTALKVIARYLWLIVWPAKLSSDYSYPEIPPFRGSPSDWTGCAAALAAVAMTVYLYKRNRTACFWLCFASFTFFPMSNLALPIGTIMAERFMYLPSIGLIACLVMAIQWAFDRLHLRSFAPAVVCLIIAAFAARTWSRNADWLDDLSITRASLEASPNSYKLHRQMAALLYGAERTPENMQRGQQEAEKSVALLDSLPDAQNTAEPFCIAGGYNFLRGEMLSAATGTSGALSNTGNAEYQKGIARVNRCAAIDKAVHAAYLATLRSSRPRAMLAPEGDPQPYLMLSSAHTRLGEFDKAADAAREALRMHPRTAAGYLQAANVFMRKNLRDDAETALSEGVLLTPDPALAQALASLYQNARGGDTCRLAGSAINPECPPFREQVCKRAATVLKARIEMSREDLAEQERHDLVQNYGCPAAPLDAVLAGR